jgi:hypothetical protein
VVVCVEPVPAIFTALEANLSRIATISPESAVRVRALNCGVSDGTKSMVRNVPSLLRYPQHKFERTTLLNGSYPQVTPHCGVDARSLQRWGKKLRIAR